MGWPPWRRDMQPQPPVAKPSPDAPVVAAPRRRMTTGEEAPAPPDIFTGTIASLGRTFFIQKLILLPKLKAAAFFQPEHSFQEGHVQRPEKERVLRSKSLATWGARGGIFASGCLLFLGHDVALHLLHRDEHYSVEDAPASSSFIAGGVGGSLYAAVSTPIVNWLNGNDLRAKNQIFRGLFVGSGYTLVRDIGGFAIYFGFYTYLRHLGHDIFEDPHRKGKVAAAAMMAGGVNSNSQLKPKPPTEQQSALAAFQHLPLHIALSSAAGGGAGLATYLWRSPWDTLFKVSLGMRAKETALVSARRFLTSPRGIKATAVGAATWGIYEGVWTVLEHAASVGENESSL